MRLLNWTARLPPSFDGDRAVPEPRTPTAVGPLAAPGVLADVEEITQLPAALSPVTVADDGTLTRLGRGALAVTHTSTTAPALGRSPPI